MDAPKPKGPGTRPLLFPGILKYSMRHAAAMTIMLLHLFVLFSLVDLV